MSASGGEPVVLITGGAGFIGTNLAHRLLAEGRRVLILDNLSRAGVRANLRFLQERHPTLLEVNVADVRDEVAVARAVDRASEIYHLAAQVAVTTSLENPSHDFEVNAHGTLNILEAVRRRRSDPPALIFTSTNKVYGGLSAVPLQCQPGRYVPCDDTIAQYGISETQPLDFHSPYGCSKGAADQYVLDYARSYGIPALVFRMSCIYGPHQFGNEDQGWVAHFLIRAARGQPLVIYGDGRQVRDILFVEDLVEAFLFAGQAIGSLAGQAFNIGGGPANAVSLLELLEFIGKPAVKFAQWRKGDQRYYVTDARRFSMATGWRPTVVPSTGVRRLAAWLERELPAETAA